MFPMKKGIRKGVAIARNGYCARLIRSMFNERESANMENKAPQQFPPLESVTRPNVDNAAAAYYLNRRPQTLRGWACLENGPIRPIRIHGRLAWPVAELKRVLGVA